MTLSQCGVAEESVADHSSLEELFRAAENLLLEKAQL